MHLWEFEDSKSEVEFGVIKTAVDGEVGGSELSLLPIDLVRTN